ncbi:hypothetical protein G6F56_009216 [Rhizopus delemar]|uniref:Uncharacterized protein n=1 Tax=Rhizopus stolonifer TaxID=4846 RepID=A0A367IJ30_RHIST|nr:hypothetical protein G6F56_009216 [Rhizopus delemar]RCH77670.1 hypothetical protein CU098_004821 [Rhizopus stolonifer]
MFRTRNNERTDIITSSLSTGNASIVKPVYKPTEPLDEIRVSEECDEEEEEDDDDKSLDITIESMSAVIAAAVQMSASGGSPSSLSLGSASILQPFSKIEKKKTNSSRFSIFSWKKQQQTVNAKEITAVSPTASNLTFSLSSDDDSSLQSSPRSSSVSSPKIADDGKDELQYRGIQIKEIKSTMKTLVISDDVRNPMPQVKLERPGFARINY